jgi:hypothetical protein
MTGASTQGTSTVLRPVCDLAAAAKAGAARQMETR